MDRVKPFGAAALLAVAACGILWGEYYLWWNSEISKSGWAIFGFVIATIIALYVALVSLSIFSFSRNATWLQDSLDAANGMAGEMVEGCGIFIGRLIGIGIAIFVVLFVVFLAWNFLIQYMAGATILIATLLVIIIVMLGVILSALIDVRKAILSLAPPHA